MKNEPTIPLPRETAGTALDTYLDAVAERECCADVASLRPLLAPESVAVIGASRSRGTVGRAILDNIRDAGFAGSVYAVNPHARQIGGERCLASALELPEHVDLAIIAVPPPVVLETAEQCGQRGVRSLVVITSGLDRAACADVLATCRRHGMRLVGPNCFGVAVPSIGLDATFAASRPVPGAAGLVMQSGGLGFAVAHQLSRLGIGISSFASVGDKLDVSSNDMLRWWDRDQRTRLAIVYTESFGNPRKFARTARRVGARMPVLAVESGRPAAGQRAAACSTAAVATTQVTARALFRQAGIIAVPGFGELIETAALLATQPVPAGGIVSVVSNVGGAGVLMADACTEAGLSVHRPRGLNKRRLRALIPETGTVDGPVDTTAAISAQRFRQVLEAAAEDEEVSALIALVLPTAATGDLIAAVQQADIRVPVAVVVPDQAESVRLLPRPDGHGSIPAYGYPEAAVAALSRAAEYGKWRAGPRGIVPELAGIRTADARALTEEFLRQEHGGGWLPPGQVVRLLRCYGIPLVPRPPMITGGTEVIAGVADDTVFGPLVVFGLGGAATEALADTSARLTPLTDTDADALIRSVSSAPLLLGDRGRPAADLAALRDVLLRIARLADDLPEICDLDLNPVVARPDGAFVVDARIRVTRREARDPFLRDLH